MSNEATPDTPSAAYNKMAPIWHKVQTVLDGTEAMRGAKEKYLPRYEKEAPRHYMTRRKAAVLHNVTDLTLSSWVGRPFSDPVQPDDKTVPTQMEEYLEDIDRLGNNITVFSRKWFREGVAKALAHVLVEMPSPPPENPDGTFRTKADDIADGIRPYWTFILPENLIYASATMVQSREVLTQIRIRENAVVQDGWGEKVIQRIRVIRNDDAMGHVSFEVWEYREDDKKWFQSTPPTPMDIDVIPLVTFYADRSGLMQGKPPLEDLSDLNIAHWQSSSDQRSILSVARFPILGATGISEEEANLLLAPRILVFSRNEGARFFYIEHGGKAINAGRQDLLDLEEQMAEYGADFLRKRPGDTTATARALDSAEATSPLQDVTIRFNDALQQAMDLTAKYLGVETVGTVSVATDFGPEEIVNGDLEALRDARKGRDISRERYLQELRRRGVLSEEFDAKENEKELESEDDAIFDGAPVDGKPIDDEQGEE